MKATSRRSPSVDDLASAGFGPGAIAGVVALAITMALALYAFEAWLIMLLIGVLASYVDAVPAIGFIPTLVGLTLLNVVASIFRRRR